MSPHVPDSFTVAFDADSGVEGPNFSRSRFKCGVSSSWDHESPVDALWLQPIRFRKVLPIQLLLAFRVYSSP